jgi:hypothetical protein
VELESPGSREYGGEKWEPEGGDEGKRRVEGGGEEGGDSKRGGPAGVWPWERERGRLSEKKIIRPT